MIYSQIVLIFFSLFGGRAYFQKQQKVSYCWIPPIYTLICPYSDFHICIFNILYIYLHLVQKKMYVYLYFFDQKLSKFHLFSSRSDLSICLILIIHIHFSPPASFQQYQSIDRRVHLDPLRVCAFHPVMWCEMTLAAGCPICVHYLYC